MKIPLRNLKVVKVPEHHVTTDNPHHFSANPLDITTKKRLQLKIKYDILFCICKATFSVVSTSKGIWTLKGKMEKKTQIHTC